MTTGEMIKAARNRAGLTQKELAAKLKLATGTVQQYELDKRQPRLEQLRAIAAALDVSVTELIDDWDIMDTEDGDTMTTGELIKSARKSAHITQKKLGEKLGVAYQTVAQWENDLRNPKLDTLQRIAAALDIPLASLLGIGALIDGVYTTDEVKVILPSSAKPTGEQIGAAYEKATPHVQRIVEVSLEPFMNTSPTERK